MLKLLSAFLVFQLLYHGIVTVGGYGFNLFSPEKIAIFRDMLRGLICIYCFLQSYRLRPHYFKWRKKIWLFFMILIVFTVSLSFFFFDKTFQEILIGIKYGLRYLSILFWASGLGYFLSHRTDLQRSKLFSLLKWSLLTIILCGRVRQFAKLLFPDFFMSIGYGALDDFHFGVQPPLYYLTGYEGSLRRQGLFSWPNNYGYFLTLFLPLILVLFPLPVTIPLQKRKKADLLTLSVQLLWICTIIATLSRAALIATVLILILQYRQFLRQRCKLLRIFGVFLMIGSLGLSLLKRESTLIHMQKKFWAISDIIHQPQGYGLGSSGPAVHHTGSFLPENFYFQLLLDMGTIGFILRCGVIYLFLQMQIQLNQQLKTISPPHPLIPLLRAFQQAFLVFLITGLFLHIFEDSMVNYLFLLPYGICLGYLQRFTDHYYVLCSAPSSLSSKKS